jgi:hypothetical protein
MSFFVIEVALIHTLLKGERLKPFALRSLLSALCAFQSTLPHGERHEERPEFFDLHIESVAEKRLMKLFL